MKKFLLLLLVIFATIQSNFAQNNCPTPITPNITVQNNVAVLTWNSIVSSSNNFTVAYKKLVDSTWTTGNVSGFAFTMGNLINCTQYQAKVRLNCVNNTTSDYTIPINFTSGGCTPCNLAIPITYSLLNDSIATFALSGNTTTTYNINYRVQGTNTWSILSGIPTPTFQVVLKKCTKYEFIFTAFCNNDTKTTNLVVETTGCNVTCLKPIVTATPGNNNITLDFAVPSPITTVLNYIIKYRRVGDSTFTTINNIKGNTFHINGQLLPCTKYEIQVAQICSTNSISDYTTLYVTTEGCSATCIKPVVNTSIGDSIITLAFLNPNTLNPTYVINYRKVGDSTFTTINHNGANPLLYINGLTPCTKYEIKVTQICSNGTISDATVLTLVTSGCNPVCSLDSFKYTLTNDTIAIISWVTTNKSGVKLEYRKSTDLNYTLIGNNITPYYTIILNPCTKYIFRATLLCNGQNIVKELDFTTTGCAVPCPKPSGISVSIDSTKATVVWTSSTPSSNYSQVLFKKATDSLWTTTFTNGGFTKVLNNLMPCTKYNVKVAVMCTLTTNVVLSDYTEISFTTLGCNNNCTKPDGISVSIGTNLATVNWKVSNTTITQYKVLYKKSTDSTWATINATGLSTILSNLMPCTKYTVKVAAICGNAMSDFTEISFTTLGCTTTCEKPIGIATANVDNIVLTFTNKSITGVVPVFIIMYRKVGDSTFTTVTVTGLAAILKNLMTCSKYEIKVQQQCGNTLSDPLTLYAATNGCKPTCEGPTKLVGKYNADTKSITLTWVGTATSYIIEYTVNGNTFQLNTTSNTISIPNILPCNIYQFRVTSICIDGNNTTQVTSTINFSTPCLINNNCRTPNKLSVTQTNNVDISWNNTGANQYIFEIKKDNDINWTSSTTTNTNISLTTLQPCTFYSIRVTSQCGKSMSTPSTILRFKTKGTGCFTSGNGVVTASIRNTYPNPISTNVTLEYELQAEDNLSIEFYNSNSIMVKRIELGVQQEGDYNTTIDDLDLLTSGLNYMIIRDKNKTIIQSKIIIKQ